MKHTTSKTSKSHDAVAKEKELSVPDSAPETPAKLTPLEELEQEKIRLEGQVEQYRNQSLHAAADLENYRKRMIREKEEIIRYANSSLLEKLLPILDNFELGLEAARASAEGKAVEIVNGFSMVQRQLSDFLKENGLHIIEVEGVPFDPKWHEAIGQEAHETLPEGHIIKQLRRGYRLAERLIRPASVIVSKGKEDGQA